MYLTPEQSLNVTIAQPCEAREDKSLLYYLIAARCSHRLFQFLDGKVLSHGVILLRFLLRFKQLERIAVYQSFCHSFGQGCRHAVDEDAAGGVAKSLLTEVEGASFEKGDEATAEVTVNFLQCHVRLAYIIKVLHHACLCVASGAHGAWLQPCVFGGILVQPIFERDACALHSFPVNQSCVVPLSALLAFGC